MTHLKVAVRIRPLSQREVNERSVSVVQVQDDTIFVTNEKVPQQNAGDSRERIKRFSFDYCFGPESTQNQVFDVLGKEVETVIKKRQNCCILAYGQSSSGKTHTMMGNELDRGLTPKLCHHIFDYLDDFENRLPIVSFLEIYNEKVRDLLVDEASSGDGSGRSLRIREHPKKGPYVQGLKQQTVSSVADLLHYLELGNCNRKVASTLTNQCSSRSHSIFTLTCEGGVQLRLVDLAGSERAGSRCQNVLTLKEGGHINKGLVALGNVISTLAEKSRKRQNRFVPYRDSVLTWLLKDTLGGNSHSIMIATISPSSTCYNETVNTLWFGQRAKQIVTRPVVIEDPKERVIRELRLEITKLKELIFQKQVAEVSAPASDRQDKPSQSEENSISTKNANTQVISQSLKAGEESNIKSNCETDKQTFVEEPKTINVEVTKPAFLEGPKNLPNVDNIAKQDTPKVLNVNSTVKKVFTEKRAKTNVLSCIKKSWSSSQPEICGKSRQKLSKSISCLCLQPTELYKLQLFPLSELETKQLKLNTDQLVRLKLNSDQLVRCINVETNVKAPEKPLPTIRKKLAMQSKTSKPFGSEETIGTKPSPAKRLSQPSILRKQSMDKTTSSSLRSLLLKKSQESKGVEKGVATDGKSPKVEIKKPASAKPRSQIVRAVTNRLYDRSKKKDVGTGTEASAQTEGQPQELTICSNARSRLHELSQRALRATRKKNAEVQTVTPKILRVKEISTDAEDLKTLMGITKEVETCTTPKEYQDASNSCQYLEGFNLGVDRRCNAFLVTRSCGTQSVLESAEKEVKPNVSFILAKARPNVSFTKYLRNELQPRIEIVNTCPASPVYTSTVNINVSHNFIDANVGSGDSISDDSLEDQIRQNVCFPTPDIISNHNSLEPQAHAMRADSFNIPPSAENSIGEKIAFASACEGFENLEEFSTTDSVSEVQLECIAVPACKERVTIVTVPEVRATETRIVSRGRCEEHCGHFPQFQPQACCAQSSVVCRSKLEYADFAEEPVVLKTVIKKGKVKATSTSGKQTSATQADLEQEIQNKHCCCASRRPVDNDSVVTRTVSRFMEEATCLMTNLSLAASKLQGHTLTPSSPNANSDEQLSYELQVTINGLNGLQPPPSRKPRRRQSRKRQLYTITTQTYGDTQNAAVQTSFGESSNAALKANPIQVATNKYDQLLKSSCDQLEKCSSTSAINNYQQLLATSRNQTVQIRPIEISSNKYEDLVRSSCDQLERCILNVLSKSSPGYEQSRSRIPSVGDDYSSLDSVVTVSDYGSMPRSRGLSRRDPSCSPSAYLRNLIAMRKHVVETAREDIPSFSHSDAGQHPMPNENPR